MLYTSIVPVIFSLVIIGFLNAASLHLMLAFLNPGDWEKIIGFKMDTE